MGIQGNPGSPSENRNTHPGTLFRFILDNDYWLLTDSAQKAPIFTESRHLAWNNPELRQCLALLPNPAGNDCGTAKTVETENQVRYLALVG